MKLIKPDTIFRQAGVGLVSSSLSLMKKITLLFSLITIGLIGNSQIIKDSLKPESKVLPKSEHESQSIGVWQQFLDKNLDMDVPIRNGAPPGKYTVVINFIIDTTGSVTKLYADTDYGYGMEQEVIRVLKKSPKWKPAYQNGHLVKSMKKQPVIFIVSAE